MVDEEDALRLLLFSDLGTNKTVKARIWPWLSDKSPVHDSFFVRKRVGMISGRCPSLRPEACRYGTHSDPKP